jgi:hypothetical protein
MAVPAEIDLAAPIAEAFPEGVPIDGIIGHTAQVFSHGHGGQMAIDKDVGQDIGGQLLIQPILVEPILIIRHELVYPEKGIRLLKEKVSPFPQPDRFGGFG